MAPARLSAAVFLLVLAVTTVRAAVGPARAARDRSLSALAASSRALVALRERRALLGRSEEAMAAFLLGLQADTDVTVSAAHAAKVEWWYDDFDAKGLAAELRLRRALELVRGALSLSDRGRLQRIRALLVALGDLSKRLVLTQPPSPSEVEVAERVYEARAKYDDVDLRAIAIGRLFLDAQMARERTSVKHAQLDAVVIAATARLERAVMGAEVVDERQAALLALRLRAELRAAAATAGARASEEVASSDDRDATASVQPDYPPLDSSSVASLYSPPPQPPALLSMAARRARAARMPARIDAWRSDAAARAYAPVCAEVAAVTALLVNAARRADEAIELNELERFTAVRGSRDVQRGNFSVDLLCNDPTEGRRRERLRRRGKPLPEPTRPGFTPRPVLPDRPSLLQVCTRLPVRAWQSVATSTRSCVFALTDAVYPTIEQQVFKLKLSLVILPALFFYVQGCDLVILWFLHNLIPAIKPWVMRTSVRIEYLEVWHPAKCYFAMFILFVWTLVQIFQAAERDRLGGSESSEEIERSEKRALRGWKYADD
ncbi:hypothetical protein T492DRAFT_907509 [Pavlovales sp. CCMP2436]|nr:hypothetical protein T492DRAFT_907509 [Pavlovales sp. CCMP2436]